MTQLTYTIQRNGQVTLPPELRAEYKLRQGDQVIFTKGANGWFIVKKEPDPIALLDQLGDMLREKGITMEEILADGEKIREQLFEERYGSAFPKD